jgi:2-C-methyl-D-erythritol 4-phosphate cytidylyltransferase
LLASGEGSRFGGEKLKQLTRINGKTILEHTIMLFDQSNLIDQIVIVCNSQVMVLEDYFTSKYKKLTMMVQGGSSRTESTWIGLQSLKNKANPIDKVLIHDGVRPFLDHDTLENLINALDIYDAVNTIIDSTDTMLLVEEEKVVSIPDRSIIKRGQTPQGFKYHSIVEAFRYFFSINSNLKVTDDCAIYLNYWGDRSSIYTVKGSQENIKITYPIDVITAEALSRFGSFQSKLTKKNINNKVAVIFGGTQGIGKYLVEQLELSGVKVHCFSRKNGCDIRNVEHIKQALEKASLLSPNGIDFIINCAGILYSGKLIAMIDEHLQDMINTNFLANVHLARQSYEYLKKTKGMLVLFSSSSYLKGRGNTAVYSATKAAIANLTQALSEEWFIDSISVNCVAPSRTDTPMRTNNFNECDELQDLLSPSIVAKKIEDLLRSDATGLIFRVSSLKF